MPPPDRDTDLVIRNPERFAANMVKVARKSAELLRRIAGQSVREGGTPLSRTGQVSSLVETFLEIARAYLKDPARGIEAQANLWQDYAALWYRSWNRVMGIDVAPVAEPSPGDKRFRDKAWHDNPVFAFLMQSYLLTANWARDMVRDAEGVDSHTRHKADFYVTQIANALAPTNFALTNPEVLREIVATDAGNLLRGLDKLIEDLERGGGRIAIRQTDLDAFEVGRNLALTPGKVVFQNELMQLIQYAPTTPAVHRRPLLIVPPWINKYYILDLTPEKSFIRWAVDQGLTVFVISWINPDARLAAKRFEDYMNEGILAALHAIEQATGEREANAIGYCIGGTLLAVTLAWMAATGDKRVRSATFLATQVDFANAGDLKVFVDEKQLDDLESEMAAKGVLEGRDMALAFNMLRSNDLIWSAFVDNYLLGRDPMPFDLLYWNADSTNMPAAMHSEYLRCCYLRNDLSRGRMTIGGRTIDLSKVGIPVYNLATRDDHIAPMASVFLNGRHLRGPTRFVVAGSGHIAGVVNPPASGKYRYWTDGNADAASVENWLAGAREHPGSWWPDWKAWIFRRSGRKVPARQPGDGRLKPIEDAPGSYVRMRSDRTAS